MLHSSDGGVVDGVGDKDTTKSLKREMLMLEEASALNDIVEKMKGFPGKGELN